MSVKTHFPYFALARLKLPVTPSNALLLQGKHSQAFLPSKYEVCVLLLIIFISFFLLAETYLAVAAHTTCSLSRSFDGRYSRFNVDLAQNFCFNVFTYKAFSFFYHMRHVFLHEANNFGTRANHNQLNTFESVAKVVCIWGPQ